MNDVVGSNILIADGINAIIEASSTNKSIKPKYFRFSEQDLILDPNLSAGDISAWITRDISSYIPINNNKIEFVCDVEPSEAKKYTRVCGLFLEDGTLFALAKPPFPFPPHMRQTFKIQIEYQNIAEIANFEYIETNEVEQHASDIANMLFSADLRLHTLKETTKITKIEGGKLV